jgi:hypothetical protein
MAFNGISWELMTFNGISWELMAFNGISRELMAFNGISRELMTFNGISWELMAFNGIQWDLMGFNGISWELLAFNGISIQWDVMVINGCNGILREIPSLQTVCEVDKHHCSLANHLHFGVICHSKLLDYDAVPPERMEFYGKVRRMPKAKPFRAPALW